MRPSWPPPITPSQVGGFACGRKGCCVLFIRAAGSWLWRRRSAGVRNASSLAASASSVAASIATAVSAALAAPASPMAKVATGTPFGICTIDSSESSPRRYLEGTGTPSTGTMVLAAIMPGRWAAPPAPAMIARRPRARALLGVGEHLVGHAVRRNHLRFVGNAELLQHGHRVLHHVPVGRGTHHDADQRLCVLLHVRPSAFRR